ncbi:hypothetical protein J3R30DRAFT_3402348 [Lentinula aciculospora]|uniref:LysM domain-containing protein n=1 Tax=Lentinula aciculospora TaxID=153920 RepID=A0A9W9AKM8_9AGAR|nr:hypothetical protein J3R30DRAFT_3402348 [Lentinula aciculospora]
MFNRLSLFAIVTALGAISEANLLCVPMDLLFRAPTLFRGLLSIDANRDNIYITEQLCIPAAPAPTSVHYYTVVSGDYDITVAQLEAANPDIDSLCDNLDIGEVVAAATCFSSKSAHSLDRTSFSDSSILIRIYRNEAQTSGFVTCSEYSQEVLPQRGVRILSFTNQTIQTSCQIFLKIVRPMSMKIVATFIDSRGTSLGKFH